MKYTELEKDLSGKFVALFTRAWIEISFINLSKQIGNVALFTRAWIEII